jgi:hypothetical protein
MLPPLLATPDILAQIDVSRSLGAALIGAGVLGTVAAGRWVMKGTGGEQPSGSGRYVKLAVIMALGLGLVFAGVALQTS